ncbi:prolyl oligopeptidase family serine peptidase [Bifidobacterium longum subsp. infantis]|uniref:Prolyl oligopeptidase family serine peptidase n=1 Tax=Bifidobacterium longum subsp. infantis TaxID=1682 RepID=A0A7D4XWB8_BIFLI|nr:MULTISPECIES: prolyl oligopeptidase family serine peptidase [Bifidobacterium]KAB1945037.1 prolyl oligopeptidase family serine peptidase [Bifidobacterium longum subsp. infantis]KEY27008.1 cytochrome C [Bifidobacterium longum subsp. infantis EK3]MED7619534.1 peptidase [Bifidobacterium longum subsp. infantis]NQX50162.1 prolyl oligopeptidase family serine peptidase [Bifidobacterium longum subsp. infantis]QKY12488.1 prolyl oligopeptidase family serine peptidase [Bifidobacterium longum subsp. inf
MSETNDVNDAIKQFPRLRARTLRFGCGAPRSAQVVGDGSRALFLRSDGPQDLVTALWLSWFDESGEHHETKLADPRELLGATADSEDVPAEEKARRERAREGGTGIVGYSSDDDGNRIVFTINGRLFLTDIDWNDETGAPEPHTRELAGEWRDEDPAMYTPVLNPRIAPDGEHVLYTTGSYLMLVDIGGELGDRITAVYGVSVEDEDGNPAENTWKIGLAEFVAGEEMDRYDGFWWAPDSQHVLFESFDTADEPTWYISDPADPEKRADGRRYPRALTRNADVYLTVITLAFDENDRYAGITGNADVDWDREAYEYVAAVNWRRGHDPLVLVQNRRQTRDQVLEVAVAADGAALGATRVLEEHANDQWIDLIHGTPAYTPDGRLVCPLNDMAADTNRLTVDGRPFTPAGWNVRAVLDVTDDDVLAVVQRAPEIATEVPRAWAGSDADSDAESLFGGHDARSFDVVSIDYNGTITPVTTDPGQWTASRGERGIVVSGRDMRSARAQMRHILGEQSATISSTAAEPGFAPNVTFTRLGEHRLYTAIIAPSPSSPYAHSDKLPVLMKPYGGPGFQQVVASQSFYWEGQWWADQGFLVVTADGRGTTGRGPAWDREIFEDMKDVTLADQIEAVNALPEAVSRLNADGCRPGVPMPDLDKVCMIGWSYGGFLSALAVLDAPDVFKAACAGAPPTDWTLYDTHYTERYLGLDPDVYRRNGIVQDAPGLVRPLMLIHGFADDNVTIAHSLRLSQALMAAGRPHTFLPLTGITHMTNDETVAENLLTLQRDFLRDALA